jgi:tetratricopeptide (TPR) repeat protein
MRRALADNQRAVRLDSTNVEALHQLAPDLYAFGLLDSALAVERSATRRDPFYAYPYGYVAWILNTAGRPLEALTWTAQGIAIDSSFGPLERYAADAYLQLGRPSEARASAQRAMALGQEPASMRAFIAIADLQEHDTTAALGEIQAAAQGLRDRLARSTRGLSFLLVFPIAGAYAQLGQPDSAIAWLQRIGLAQRRSFGGHLLHHWLWNPLRAVPRFQALLAESQP